MTRTDVPARILVCDDEELIRWSLVEHLKGLGHHVSDAVDGQDCLDKIADGTPDLLVTDLKMPRIDGLELLRRIREQGLEIPAIVMTAHGDLDAAIESTRLGASAFVNKPFDLREMAFAIEKVLDHHRLRTEVRYLREQQSGTYGRLIGESVAMKRLTREELRQGALMYPPVYIPRPSSRAECREEMRPCPWVACKHHLYLDINPETGSIKINFPDLEPHGIKDDSIRDVIRNALFSGDSAGAGLRQAGPCSSTAASSMW